MAGELVRDDDVLAELRRLIEAARGRVAVAVNRELVLLYWDLGHRLRVEVLGEERAEYGERILQTLSAKLTQEFGRGYGVRNLANMVKFAESFPERTVVERLSWSHYANLWRLGYGE